MAKSGLDYFPLACNFEDKIELIEAEFGLSGLAIIVKLYQKIYGELGYYCEWNDEVALLFSRKACGLQEGDNVVSEVIKSAFKRKIFDGDMFAKYGILTSAGIQKRYFEAAKRRTEIEVEKSYLLISASKIPNNVNIISKNVCRKEENVCRNQQSKVKESKVKKNRERARVEDFISAYPIECNRHLTGIAYCDLIVSDTVSEDNLIQSAKNYAETCKILKTPEQYIKHAENFIKDMVFVKYLPENYKKPEKKNKSGFNDFSQRNYDFSSLENQLLPDGRKT